NAENLSEKTLIWQTVIHMTFVFSAIAIAYIDKIMRVENKH
ncbi:MAG: TIGR00645 family protein, partial [Methylotenera sp.]